MPDTEAIHLDSRRWTMLWQDIERSNKCTKFYDKDELAKCLETQTEVEQFLYYQADVLDERRWDEWLGLFTDDGYYWMPASSEQTVAEGQPNIFCHKIESIF